MNSFIAVLRVAFRTGEDFTIRRIVDADFVDDIPENFLTPALRAEICSALEHVRPGLSSPIELEGSCEASLYAEAHTGTFFGPQQRSKKFPFMGAVVQSFIRHTAGGQHV